MVWPEAIYRIIEALAALAFAAIVVCAMTDYHPFDRRK
jgi:uncharacterized paraquat-inducible protein A